MPRHVLRSLALAVLAALAACGGSGGAPPPVEPPEIGNGDATFDGAYYVLLKAGGHDPAPVGRASTGILVANGAGAALHSQLVNHAGAVTGPTTTPYAFDVAPDGRLEFAVAGTLFARGGLTTDGQCAVLGSVANGAFPGILVLRRRQGFHSDASLSGSYHFVQFSFGTPAGLTASATGSAVFNGTGGATITMTSNGMGTIIALGAVPMPYSVIADGNSTLGNLEGGVVEGGRAAIWGGSTVDLEAPAITAVVKESTSAGLSTLSGAYWIVLLERDPGSDDFRSLDGTATADGAGGLTLLATSNTEGVLAAEPLQTTTYIVTVNGRLTVDAGGSALVGGVSADGRFAVLAGGTVAGSSPTIAFLCRK